MGLLEELNKLNRYLDDGTYRAQYEYGSEELRLELLETADLLFEVADKVEEVLTDFMVRQKFGIKSSIKSDD
ncbi:MAG: hypothetical protein HQK55_10995 [Deltaproteobacteria bacterium]|nr:hypothetical protein [Deltaproteobacteria bacterium]